MDHNLECEDCGGTNFYKESGFFYCQECQTQSQQVQEHVFEVDATAASKKQGKKVVKEDKKGGKDALTSWECYNIILKGLTEELIKCGAKPDLKKVAKLLFMKYLHLIQIIAPKKDTAPQINLFTSKHDIAVVYGIKKRKRKRSSSESNSTYSRASTIRQRTRKKMALVKSQYEEFSQNSTQETALSETSLTELSSGSKKVEKSKKIKFNTATRKHLKTVMTKGHFYKHTADFQKELACHKLTWKKNEKLQKNKIKNITVATLYHILYLGLLIVKDKIQLGDLLRFIREGHVSFGAYFHLFPEDCQEKKLSVPRFKQKLSFKNFREKSAEVAHFLEVEKHIERPNLMELCERYVEELNLPREILSYVEKLIVLSEPEMNFTEKSRFMPNYEARAFSFIIFVLKLFFGLDGKAEFEISEYLANFENLFNFEKWLTYIKYRKCVIEKYHFPSRLEDDSTEVDSDMFLRYLKTQSLDYKHDNKPKQLEVSDFYQVLEKIKNIPLNTDNTTEIRQNFFDPSLTPFLNYVRKIPNSPCQDIIDHDFSQDSLSFILEPSHYVKMSDGLDYGLNNNSTFKKVFYYLENKGRTFERSNSKNVVVKISNTESYNEAEKSSNNNATKDLISETEKSWESSNKFTFEKNRTKLGIPFETKTLPFERFWLNIPASPASFYTVIPENDTHKFLKDLPFSSKTLLQEGSRLLEQDVVSFYGEYILTELILVYREDLYLKNYNKIKSKDRNFKLALKGCLERW